MSINGLPRDMGPAIQMELEDHLQTASHGSQPNSPMYRARQQTLIREGRFGEAIQMDIDNIRKIPGVGTRYDNAIREMLGSLDPWMRKGLRRKPL